MHMNKHWKKIFPEYLIKMKNILKKTKNKNVSIQSEENGDNNHPPQNLYTTLSAHKKKKLPQKKIKINIPKNLIERIIHHLVPKIKIESRGRGESNPSLARGGCFRRNCFSGRKCQRWKWTLWKMKSRCRLPAPPRGTRRGLKSRRWGEEGDLAYISAGREVVFVLWLLGKIYFFSCFSFLFVTRLRKILLWLWFYSCWGFLNVIVVYFLIRSPCSKGLFRKAITSAIILFRCTFLYEPRLDINLCPRASPRLSVKGKQHYCKMCCICCSCSSWPWIPGQGLCRERGYPFLKRK